MTDAKLVNITTMLASAYVSNNSITVGNLPQLINKIHRILNDLTTPTEAISQSHPKPAVPVSKSVTKNFIICLEDGEKFKLLKRHIRSRYNMSPAEYREKWKLPGNYPMVAPSYSAKRRTIAKVSNLGRQK